MTKKFSLLQLFSLVDGRLSTSIDDVYEMLNHICDDNLMTHHLPVAVKYLKEKNPAWLQQAKAQLESLDIYKEKEFGECFAIVNDNNTMYDVPQLKDELDTTDFGDYMVHNSLLLKKATAQ